MTSEITRTSKGMIKDEAYWVVSDIFSNKIEHYKKLIKNLRHLGNHSLANEYVTILEHVKEYAERAGIDPEDYEVEEYQP